MSYLILVRHGLSEYNKKGLWTGRDDPDLAPEGVTDAQAAAEAMRDLPIDLGFTSLQKRHAQTIDIIKKTLTRDDVPITKDRALNERDYGVYTGRNKWEVQKELGDEAFMNIRRGWDYPIEEGESLKQVHDRVVHYYINTILPELKAGKNVIISSSGNALRSLVKFLENIPDEDIPRLEIATGEVYVYQLDDQGNIVSKEIRNQKENTV